MAGVRVAFASTAYGPIWRPAVDSWLRVIAKTQKHLVATGQGEMGGVGITDRMYTHSADNTLIKDFLADPTLTHLFHTECDMVLPDDAILKLLALNQPIASGLYFIRNGKGQPCLYAKMFQEKHNPYPHSPVTAFPTDRPFKLGTKGGCPGLGCVLFQREVFEKIEFPWFDLKESTYGSDMYFYTKALWADYEVWIDPTIRCDQVDYQVVGFADYEKRLKEDPHFAGSGVVIGDSV